MVDIDGVISLFGFAPSARPDGSFHSIDGIPHFLSASAARNLLALVSSFELVWASGWEEKADEYLPHLLGLPAALPHLSFAPAVGGMGGMGGVNGSRATATRAHWKLDAIDAYAGAQRPLAWIDDAFNDACLKWAQARAGATLLVATAPDVGLTEHEADRLMAWADALTDADED
jgi:hypothetical protein